MMHRDGSTILGGHSRAALDAADLFVCNDCGSVEDNDAYKRNTPEGEPLCKRCGDHETACEGCGEATLRQFITHEDICTDCAEDVKRSNEAVQDEPRMGDM